MKEGPRIISFICAVLLSACAATYPEVPIAEGSQIIFKRNPGFAGVNCMTQLLINNENGPILNIGSTAHIELSPGRHRIDVISSSGACSRFGASRIIVAESLMTAHITIVRE